MNFRISSTIIVLVLGFIRVSEAQFAPQNASVRGEVAMGERDAASNLLVVLSDEATHSTVEQRPLLSDGQFVFERLKPGSYQLRVVTPQGNTLSEQSVVAGYVPSPMTIRLEDPNKSAKQAGTVTLAALRHPPSPRVLEQMAHAVKLLEKNRPDEALERLEKARGMDPEFPGVYRALGLLFLHQKQMNQALAQFQTAVQLDPQDSKSLADLGVVYFQCSRWRDAEDAVRRSLAADHAQKKARLVLGMSLVRQHQTTDEAFKALREAQSDFPDARLGIAQCFLSRNDVKNARAELQVYVDTESAAQKELAGRWLTQLKGATVAAAR